MPGRLRRERVQQRLDGGMLRAHWVDFGRGQPVLDVGVGQPGPVHQAEHRSNEQLHEAVRRDRAQLGAAGLDVEALLIRPGRGVALAQDDVVIFGAAEGVGEGHQLGENVVAHGSSL